MANPLQQALQRQFLDDAFSNKLKPIKPALSHVGLYIGLIIYTAVGALVSCYIILFELSNYLQTKLSRFSNIWNIHWKKLN